MMPMSDGPPLPESDVGRGQGPTGSAQPSVKVVLFDMGGVLVRLGSLPELLGGGISDADFWPRWLSSPAVRAFERGRCSPQEFSRGVVDDLELSISPTAFLANFSRFPRGLYPGAADLVAEVRRSAEIGLLSNTNRLHWETQIDADVLRAMEARTYLSFLLGEVKPDEAIYRLVLNDLELPGDQVLFIDDNQLNVDGARRAGLRAELAKGPAQARAVLAPLGLATSSSTGEGAGWARYD